jgi:hypothetical protein
LASSTLRTDSNLQFKVVKQYNIEYEELEESESQISLQFETFKSCRKKLQPHMKSSETIKNYTSNNYKVENTSFDINEFQYNESDTTVNKAFIKNIQKDFYINESYMILNDLIDLVGKEK